jgi:hypothetical protein
LGELELDNCSPVVEGYEVGEVTNMADCDDALIVFVLEGVAESGGSLPE